MVNCMNSFIGNIVVADATEKIMEIKCPEGVSGVIMGQRVLVIPINNENMSAWGHISRYMEKYNPQTGDFDLV